MDFSTEQAVRMMFVLATTAILLTGLGNILEATSRQAEGSMVNEATMVQEISVVGEAPSLEAIQNLKLVKTDVGDKDSLTKEGLVELIRTKSALSAKDGKGVALPTESITTEISNEAFEKVKTLLNGKTEGSIQVKHSVEDSNGGKASTIKNVIIKNEGSSGEEEKVAFAVYSSTDKSLTFYKRAKSSVPANNSVFNGKLATEVYTDIEELNYDTENRMPWDNRRTAITSVTVEDEGIKPISFKYWFENFNNVKTMELSKFDTSKVTDMSSMFDDCISLTELDLSGFDTSKVTDMSFMFYNCSVLTSFDLSSFDTSKVTNMESMFTYCDSLTSLDLSSFDTSKVTDMSSMFDGCISLTELDLSSFDTSKVTNMWGMFYNCSVLTTLDVSSFDTSKVVNMGGMFYKCSVLTTLDVSSFDTSKVTNMSLMFMCCDSLTSLDLSSFDTSNVTNMDWMFYKCSVLTSLDLSSFDTSNVTNMSHMFQYCISLTELDLSSFDTSKVTNMESMFTYCDSLTSLDVSSFDTSNVTNMGWMFQHCISLTELDLSSFDTSKVTDMDLMFNSCSATTGWGRTLEDCDRLNRSQGKPEELVFRVKEEKVAFAVYSSTDKSLTFYKRAKSSVPANNGVFNGKLATEVYTDIEELNYDTEDRMPWDNRRTVITSVTVEDKGIKPISFKSWFENFNNVKTMELSKFDTSKVTNMEGMFYNCRVLTTLDVSSFDTSNVATMWGMFSNCRVLTSLDLSSFDTSKVVDMGRMFEDCSATTGWGRTLEDCDRLNRSRNKPEELVFRVKYNPSPVLESGAEFHASFPSNATAVVFTDEVAPVGVTTTDVSAGGNGSVVAWLDGATYKVSTQRSGVKIIGNPDCARMFYSRAVKTIDFDNFDTSKVTDMSRMFYECSVLTTLDLSGFDTSNVTNMDWMFCNCSGLTTLDLSSFDTSNVTNMRWMFMYCISLTELDLSSFDTSKVTNTNMGKMFEDCSATTGWGRTLEDCDRLNRSRNKPEELVFRVKYH